MAGSILTGVSFCCRSVESDQKNPDARNQPVSRVHVDYTVKSGPERLQAVLPGEAEQLMKTPFAVIQVQCGRPIVMLPCQLVEKSCIFHAMPYLAILAMFEGLSP